MVLQAPHLDLMERKFIEKYANTETSYAQIALWLKRSKGCISKEIKKNGGRKNYNADIAHHNAAEKRIEKTREQLKMNKERVPMYRTNTLRIEALEMQVEILHETLKDLLNGKNKRL